MIIFEKKFLDKNKLKKFDDLNSFSNVIQPKIEELKKDYLHKGLWRRNIFKNDNEICLELGCGKGEYTVELAKRNPHINYIGIDIKGARIWSGASESKKLKNIFFLRTRIEFLNNFFDKGEINLIWITFPDPHIKKRSESRRLTHKNFLNIYKTILSRKGFVNLKTDSEFLHGYTLGVLSNLNCKIIQSTHDLYNSQICSKDCEIKTYYEEKFLKLGKKITYIKFKFEY